MRLALSLLALSLPGVALAQEKPLVVRNATIHPVSGPPIERGTLVAHRGRIVAIGAADLAAPEDATVIDATGKILIPGLVDTHSHVGGIAGADRSATIDPSVRVVDSINPNDSGFRRVVAGGVTTMNIMPGSGHLMSGQTIYAKPRRSPTRGATVDGMIIRDAVGRPMGGLKMANGTNPLGQPPFGGTRAKSAAMVREHFVRAEEYRRKLDAFERGEGERPPRDLGLEATVEVLDGTRIVHHHTHRADDIMTVLRLRDEFGFRVVLHHVSEAWKVAEEIAAADVPSSIILVDAPGGKLEAAEISFDTAAALERAGALFAFHTDDWITDSRLFLRMAAMGVRAGLSREAALAALTINGARMLDLEDRVGSLEVGKDADFVLLSGDPFSVYTKVEATFIEGEKVFDRSDPEDRLYAVGGFGAGHDQSPYFCCYGHALESGPLESGR